MRQLTALQGAKVVKTTQAKARALAAPRNQVFVRAKEIEGEGERDVYTLQRRKLPKRNPVPPASQKGDGQGEARTAHKPDKDDQAAALQELDDGAQAGKKPTASATAPNCKGVLAGGKERSRGTILTGMATAQAPAARDAGDREPAAEETPAPASSSFIRMRPTAEYHAMVALRCPAQHVQRLFMQEHAPKVRGPRMPALMILSNIMSSCRGPEGS